MLSSGMQFESFFWCLLGTVAIAVILLLVGLSFFLNKAKTLKDKIFSVILLLLSLILTIYIGLLFLDWRMTPVIISTSPVYGGTVSNNSHKIEVVFDRPINSDLISLEINPSIKGEWRSESLDATLPLFFRKVAFYPEEEFDNNRSYFISISKIKNVVNPGQESQLGIDFKTSEVISPAKFGKTETTLNGFKLNVPLIRQDKQYSCNLEVTRMALAYRGIDKTLTELFEKIDKDTSQETVNGLALGNPHKGYVGDLNGVPSGYGVYWEPISKLISYYRDNSIRNHWNLADLLTEVRNGNPVIIWAHNGYATTGNRYAWTTASGEVIEAIGGMHSYLVIGYVGSKENPEAIILNDTNRGEIQVSIDYFNDIWRDFENSAVIVY